MLEFTLLNHPIDCPICDKAGECTLQKHYFDWDDASSRATTASRSRRPRSSTSARTSCSTRSAASSAPAASASATRSPSSHQLEMAQRGDHEVLTTAPGRAARQPVLAQHRRRLPGRRADREGLPLHDARLGARTRRRRSATGCATGCNIEIQHSRDQVYRLVPRAQPAVNKHWMCDEGRFTYKRAARPSGWSAPLSAGCPVDWDRALDDAAKRAAARARRATPRSGRRGVQRRSRPTRTSTRWRGWRSTTCSVEQAPTSPGCDQGWRDDILVSRRHEPEHRGRDGDRRGPAAQPARPGERPEGGRGRRRCWCVGTRGVAGRRTASRRRCRCDELQTLVVIGDAPADRWSTRAQVALPLADVGRGRRHVHQPAGHGPAHARRRRRRAGDALPGWEILVAPGAQAGRRPWTSTTAKAGLPRGAGRSCRS